MLDINFIRENPQKVKEACKNKNVKVDVDKVLLLDREKRGLLVDLEGLKAEQNKISRLGSPKLAGEGGGEHNGSAIKKAKDLKEKFKEMEPELKRIEAELNDLLLQLPNIPFDDVPVGKDDTENVIARQIGQPSLKLRPGEARDYMELGQKLDLIDIGRAGKVSGSRFGFIKNELALLEFALINLVMDTVKKPFGAAQGGEGFIPVIPPVIVPMVQLKVAPATLLVKAIFVEAALHTVRGLIVVTSGVGLTVMVKVCAGPSQVIEPLVK